MGLVHNAAVRLAKVFNVDSEEFLGPAYIAMTDAIRTWDASKGHRFTTHAIPALKFRTYTTVMRDLGRKQSSRAGSDYGKWFNPMGRGIKRFGHEEDPDCGVAARSIRNEDEESMASKRRHMNEVLALAAEVSPECGVTAIHLMARGLTDARVGELLGRGNRYARWLRHQIKQKIAGKARLQRAPAAARPVPKPNEKIVRSPESFAGMISPFVLKCSPESTLWAGRCIRECFSISADRSTPKCVDEVMDRCLCITQEYMREHGIPHEVMYSTCRHAVFTQCRREVWSELRRRGFSYPTIAAVCGFAHSSVLDGMKYFVPTYTLLNQESPA